MKKLQWMALVILQEIKMLKVKSLLRYVYDSEYRADINRLRDLLHGGNFTSTHKVLRLDEIKFSHNVNYPLWILKLVRQITDGVQLPPIKVIYDQKRDSWIVVDGNHRLMAYRICLRPTDLVSVRILHKKGTTVYSSYPHKFEEAHA